MKNSCPLKCLTSFELWQESAFTSVKVCLRNRTQFPSMFIRNRSILMSVTLNFFFSKIHWITEDWPFSYVYIFISVYRCSLPLGLENGHVPNGAFSASSSYNNKYAPVRARLNIHADSKGYGAWGAKTNNGRQWLQIDFGELVQVTKVATQGQQDNDHWVTKFTLSHSVDGMHWAEYKENSVTWVSKQFSHAK